MKKTLLAIVCLTILFSNKLYSQSKKTEFQLDCCRDTTQILIDKIEEYLMASKSGNKNNSYILVYIVKARYADEKHKNYMEPLLLVSMDTIQLHKEYKSIYSVNRINRNHTIKEGDSYLFHIELCGCLPIVGGIRPDSFSVNGVRLPVGVCPLQPYMTQELKGLDYLPIMNDLYEEKK